MKKYTLFLFLAVLLTSCNPRVDFIVHNAKVYTANRDMDVASAFAVKDGKFIAVGDESLLDEYQTSNLVDAQGLPVYPGFIDAHCHFLSLGLTQTQVQLEGTKSYEEVIERVKAYAATAESRQVILGRGWDQNDWENKEFPTKDALDRLFPDIPVALRRIDGHALLVNQKALDLAGIDGDTQVPGGTVVTKNGQPTGVLIDTPMELVEAILPKPTLEEKKQALLAAQEIGFKYGLTTVDDAGLNKEDILLIDSLQQTGVLDMRVYAMISNTPDNLDYFLPKGPLVTDRLSVRSVKVYADGALGSRGAALIAPYSDAPKHRGKFITDKDSLKQLAARIAKTKFQMNTHAIGDAANQAVIDVYRDNVRLLRDPRWRVEHAQVLDAPDIEKFSTKIIPSIQPLHVTSDMYWAGDRLGEDRLKNAYVYQEQLDYAGIVALGTDFPVEKVNPMLTFYAAISRRDLNGYPKEGFQRENRLSRGSALLGMTRWAAYANFEEKQKGSIEIGKVADFVMLDRDIMEVTHRLIPGARVVATFLNGKIVYSNRD